MEYAYMVITTTGYAVCALLKGLLLNFRDHYSP